MFSRLYDHLYWADRKVLESLRSARNAPARAVELYGHVLGAEHVWLARIHGTPAAVAVWPLLTLEQCDEIAGVNRESFEHHCGRQVRRPIRPTSLRSPVGRLRQPDPIPDPEKTCTLCGTSQTDAPYSADSTN